MGTLSVVDDAPLPAGPLTDLLTLTIFGVFDPRAPEVPSFEELRQRYGVPDQETYDLFRLCHETFAVRTESNPAAPVIPADAYFAYSNEVDAAGVFRSGDALMPTATATSVQVRDGRTLTTDGPFAETKEQLGGYYLIEARDQDEAVRIAGRIPGARFGSIEVRRLLAHDPRVPWDRWGQGPPS
jgi:hypothetical protein